MLLSLLLSACKDGTDKETGTTSECGVTIESSVPVQGATDAYYRGPFEFQLSDADSTATIEADFPGSVSYSEDGTVVRYAPDPPLAASTDYTVTLDYCGGSADLSFRTSEVEAPVSVDLTGRTWLFDLADARIVAPEGMAAVLAQFPASPVLLGVEAATGGSITAIEAAADASGTAQDYCAATVEFPPGDFGDDPYFHVTTDAARVSVGGIAVDVANVDITGAFAPDGSYVAGGTLTGVLDTRPLAPLTGGTDPGSACQLMSTLGVACEPCPDGERYCLTLVADQITAPEVDGVTIVPIAADECDGCDAGEPDPETCVAE